MRKMRGMPVAGLVLLTACSSGMVAMDDMASFEEPMAGNRAVVADHTREPDSPMMEALGAMPDLERRPTGPDMGVGDLDTPCEALEAAAATSAPGLIQNDATWGGRVLLSSETHVFEGATLTIQPGTVIFVESGGGLVVGDDSVLQAIGTAEMPIRFCGVQATRGYWKGIEIGAASSRLAHVVIDNAGQERAALRLFEEAVVQDILIRQSGSAGVEAMIFAPNSARLTVKDSMGPVAILTRSGAIARFPEGLETEAVTHDVLLLETDITRDLSFRDFRVPYLSESSFDIKNARVVFDAGVELQFGPQAGLRISPFANAAEVQVNGTLDSPVVFRGQERKAGFWGGVHVDRTTLTNSTLRHLVVTDAGGDGWDALAIDEAIVVDQVRVENGDRGLAVGAPGLHRDSGPIVVRNVAREAMTLNPYALPRLPAGVDLSDNPKPYAFVPADKSIISWLTSSGVIHPLTYRIRGVLQVGDVTLEIRPGARFEMEADSGIEFAWNSHVTQLTATGTSDAPIEFVGTQARSGHWKGIIIGSSITGDSVLHGVHIRDAGQYDAALVLRRSIPVTGCTLENSASFGLSAPGGAAAEYEQANTFIGNASGAVEAR